MDPSASPSPARPDSTLDLLRQSQLARVLGIGLLVLLLQIPVEMVRNVIFERQQTRDHAVHEISASWGRSQTVIGPRLVVPFREKRAGSGPAPAWDARPVRTATFLPERLEVSGELDTEMRERGIFELPVYRSTLVLRGTFGAADFSGWTRHGAEPLWEDACLVVEITDTRALENPVRLAWNDAELDFVPGADRQIIVPLGALANVEAGRFEIPLELRGSDGFFFAPLGKETRVELSADWPHPSFQGGWLPATREVDDRGFRARWSVPSLGRSFPHRFVAAQEVEKSIQASRTGVALLTPVDPYRMAERSAKYAVLFLTLTFGTLWLFEVLAGVRIHSIQYLLVGAAMCLFYLLELSLAEHIGFGASYVLASAGVIGLVAAYSASVLRKAGRAAGVAAVMVALYGYLYVLLTNEEYALLAGSLGLFAGLALVMYLTRRVDWGSLGRRLADAAKAPAPPPLSE